MQFNNTITIIAMLFSLWFNVFPFHCFPCVKACSVCESLFLDHFNKVV